ncbi:VanW family protein [Bacillus sp. JJ1122]|uniref:VanW family protein n=1 Tax=Bacillus sp. JJ1122 TaxID=3122951 RepID=UPI002FFEE35E
MGKSRKVLIVLLAAGIVGLAGCSGNSSREDELEKKIAELEKKIEKEKENTEDEKKAEEIVVEEPEPIVINVIDPTTKSVIRTFHPADLGYGTDNTKFKDEIERWARELARGTGTKAGYDQRMTLDKIGPDGQVIQGTPQTILEEAELVEKVIAASEKGGDIELPLYVTASGYKMEDVTHLGEVVVGSYTTYFNPSVAGRTKNIELSAEAINNIILGSGDVFSFNTTVGPSDAAHGYQPAEEIVNKKLVMGIGGGICQTSSTLYNAVDLIGVGYVEKHHHSLTVGYVPKGRDATVSYGGKDFKFQNTTGVPLLLKAVMGKGSLTVEVRTSKQYEPLVKKGI